MSLILRGCLSMLEAKSLADQERENNAVEIRRDKVNVRKNIFRFLDELDESLRILEVNGKVILPMEERVEYVDSVGNSKKRYVIKKEEIRLNYELSLLTSSLR